LKADGRPTFLIADLHLTPEDPATAGRCLDFLAEAAPAAGALYILGDLFEAWPGDDLLEQPFPAAVVGALRRLSDQGTAVALMHGNRDFLIGAAFCRAAGATLLADPSVLELHGVPTLLMHGDSLCTDDAAYQQIRRQVRDPAWQQAVLAKPLVERLAMARQFRDASESAKSDKSDRIMDVNADAVAAAFRQSGCSRLIHGHTHRPARHALMVDGQPRERWVLPDWYDGRGGYLRCDAAGCTAIGYA
jgi:UDP-2,3-diacylglucosamine hydrolase